MDTVPDLAPLRRPSTIQSVDRAATLLKAIADARRPPTVIELAEACGLNRSTAWRLLATLERHGLVERDEVTQRYGVGYALVGIAAAADQDSLARRAHPALERLALETRETVGLAVARRFHLVYVDQVEAPQIMAVNWLGKSVPLHATSAGKAFLAFLDEEERDALLDGDLERFTASTVTDRRTLERHGLVERDDVTQRYGVGYALLGIAAAADHESLARRARPALERLGLETRETVGLAVAKRFHLIYVDQVEAPQIMAVNWLGKSVPLHATSAGKAFLAFLEEDERDALLEGELERFTASTITDRRTLELQFDAIRRDRYCVCVGELEDALFGASAAVLGARGRPVAVVSVWGSEHRVPRSRLAEVARRTRQAADEIEAVLP